jgi:hypothetical protein
MSQLSDILTGLITAPTREVRALKGGLYLVYRPATDNDGGRVRLVAARFQVWPSDVELRTLSAALQDAFDALENRIAYDVNLEWQKQPEKDEWIGYAVSWKVVHARDIPTAAPDLAAKLRNALRLRDERKQRAWVAAQRKSVRAHRQPQGVAATGRRTGVL